jgi:hypothetical protein
LPLNGEAWLRLPSVVASVTSVGVIKDYTVPALAAGCLLPWVSRSRLGAGEVGALYAGYYTVPALATLVAVVLALSRPAP